MNESKENAAGHNRRKLIYVLFPVLFLSLAAAMIFFSWKKPAKTDLRSLAPAATLIYLETGDLGATLETLTENKAWENFAGEKPDFSLLKNIQAAVVVAGFETSEKQLAADAAVLNFKPRFILIGDTHAWESTAVSIVENQIGKFIRETYGDDLKLEKTEKRNAEIFVWTAASDGRKFYAAVSKSVIYAGNDEELLDKCLAVRQGETENLLKNENLTRAREREKAENALAFGYVSSQGVAELANVVGVSLAVAASEENAPRSFIARILPEVLRKTTREIFWTTRKTEQGIEDKIAVKTSGEVSAVFRETLAASSENRFQSKAEFLPLQFESVTRYNLKSAQLAWRSVLLVASKQLESDQIASRLLSPFSNAFFEPYAVADGEGFLSAIDSEIVTARFDETGEKNIVIAAVNDAEKVKKSIAPEINFKLPPEKRGAAEIWQSDDKSLAAAFFEDKIISGDRESVLNCLQAKENGKNFARTVQFQNMPKDSASQALTIAKDTESARKIVGVLGRRKDVNNAYTGFYTIESRFDNGGFERRTVSDFGLLGTIIEKFGHAGE